MSQDLTLDAVRPSVPAEKNGRRIYAATPLTTAQRHTLRAVAGDSHIHFGNGGGPEDEAAFQDAEIVFGSVPPEWIGDAPQLRWVQLDSTGFGQYQAMDWDAMSQRVTMTNLGG